MMHSGGFTDEARDSAAQHVRRWLSVSKRITRRAGTHLQHAFDAARRWVTHKHASEELFHAVFHATPIATTIIRLSDGKLIDVNSAFTELWDYSRAEAIGRTSIELQLWMEPAHLIDKLKENRHSDAHELQIRHRSGTPRDVLVSVAMIRLSGSAHLLVTAADLTERRRAKELEHIAHHDTLTNLPNRLLLGTRLREAIERTNQGHSSSAVLFVDLDHFKRVNDTFGHDAGDELLRIVAARLKGRLRTADTLARVGGDEFIVVLEDLTSRTEAENVAADLVEQMSKPFALSSGRTVQIGASIGVTFIAPGTADVETIIRDADCALYRAKSSGRNAVRIFA